MHMYLYMYMYMHVCVCVFTYMCVYICMYMILVYGCMSVYLYGRWRRRGSRRRSSSSPFKAQHVANTLWAHATMGREPGVCVCVVCSLVCVCGSPGSYEVGI
jgi:hypothetical protein